MAERLAEETERLYEVFGRVPRPPRVEGCPHCVEPDEDRPLLAVPVRNLEPEVLRRYAAKALHTWGDVPDFRYFLPRMLEIAAEDGFAFPDPEGVFGKLDLAGWSAWDADERTAIRDFMARWWETTVDADSPRPDAGTVLCSVGLTGVDIVPFLDRWARLASAGAIRNLHEFVLRDVTWGTSGPKLRNSYWNGKSGPYRELIAWLSDGRALAAVEEAFDRETEEETLALLEEIHMVLAVNTPNTAP